MAKWGAELRHSAANGNGRGAQLSSCKSFKREVVRTLLECSGMFEWEPREDLDPSRPLNWSWALSCSKRRLVAPGWRDTATPAS